MRGEEERGGGEGRMRGEEERGGGEGRRRGEEERGGEGRRRGKEGGEEERGEQEGKRREEEERGGGEVRRRGHNHTCNQVLQHLLPLTLCLSTNVHVGEGGTDCQKVKILLIRESTHQQPTFCFLHCSKLLNGHDVALEEGGKSGRLTHSSFLSPYSSCSKVSEVVWQQVG